ncbi:MAG TPA: tetratricopeptide repeat protein [Aquabacterium sp.]|nr:tetratricopeptide repeat protein [Aquabacterium sp.]
MSSDQSTHEVVEPSLRRHASFLQLTAALVVGGAIASSVTLLATHADGIVGTKRESVPIQMPSKWQPALVPMTPRLTIPTGVVKRALQLDWHLSLARLQTRGNDEPAQAEPTVARQADASEAAITAQARPSTESVVAQLADRQVLLIEAPAAGRSLSPQNQAVESYRHALDLQDQGRDAAALDAALQAVQLDPQHLPARRLAVALALDQGNAQKAGDLITEGLKTDPKDPELLYLQARLLAVGGANEQALAVIESLPQLRAEAQGLKAGLLAKLGRFAPAAMAYEQALKARPDNATWWLGLGVAWRAQGLDARARQAFVRAHALGQLSPDVQAWIEQQL